MPHMTGRDNYVEGYNERWCTTQLLAENVREILNIEILYIKDYFKNPVLDFINNDVLKGWFNVLPSTENC